jgi:CheY-like chemotaxis protein
MMMKKKLDCVLLIDDDDTTNFINRLIINKAGVTNHIETALNGKAAIEYLTGKWAAEKSEREQPQAILILLDINMPVMDGWEFLQAYRSLDTDHKGEIIIVILTTSSNPDDRKRAEKIPEVAGFQYKSLKPDMLDEIIKKHFAAHI